MASNPRFPVDTFGAQRIDLVATASMPNPPAGKFRIFGDQVSSTLKAIDSNGNPVIMAATLAPGSSIDGGTY